MAWSETPKLVRLRLIGGMHAELPPPVPGYRTKILDGNHLAASEHRLEELRRTWAAPLPGQTLVVLDQQLMLATEVVLCEDGHAQERSLLGQVLPLVTQDDLWMADRNFCSRGFSVWYCTRGGGFVNSSAWATEGDVGRHAHLPGYY